MKKRIIAAVMATLVGLSMVGCGSTSSDNSSQNKTDNTDSTAQAETSDGEKILLQSVFTIMHCQKLQKLTGGETQLIILKKKMTGLILKQLQ